MSQDGHSVDYRVLGVRHHGPGSARALVAALDAMAPDCVVLEGPADADALLQHVPAQAQETEADAETLEPPVALMAWRTDDPTRSAVWPFAVFSPEWQALVWARRHEVPVRFMDLPTTQVLGKEAATEPASEAPESSPETTESSPETTEPPPDTTESSPDASESDPPPGVRSDPLARLAAVAGYDDPEAWWEDAVELAPGDHDAFDLIAEAMQELRAQMPETEEDTLVREAQMRQVIREVRRDHQRVAVVCGAWHAPALLGTFPTKTADTKLLRGRPRAKTQMTWVPWTHSRLSRASGYGAGITSPGWYHHLFTAPDEPIVRWLQHVAQVLRHNDLPVSSAHVIEATRLADSLARLRGRPMPGLTEVTEATWSVMVDGSDLLLDLVAREAVVGEALGTVPAEVPTVPLDADLRATARRLRLKFEATEKVVTLDLRKPRDVEKSWLFRRLAILGINWATPESVRTQGTFKEAWTLAWQAELSVLVVEAARYGNTVEEAAGQALCARLDSLSAVTSAIEQCLLAELGDVLADLLRSLDDHAAHETDITQLLSAVPPLARSSRYGDVRGTDTTRLAHIAHTVLARACAGLGAAAAGMTTEAARGLVGHIDQVQTVIALLGDESGDLWRRTLVALADTAAIPTYLAGRVTRLLFDQDLMDSAEAATRLSLALSGGAEVEEQAGWIEGFLVGSPLLIIHDTRLLQVLDGWVRGLSDDGFAGVLAVLRRAFGAWPPTARRQIAERVAHLAGHAETPDAPESVQWQPPLLATAALFLQGQTTQVLQGQTTQEGAQ